MYLSTWMWSTKSILPAKVVSTKQKMPFHCQHEMSTIISCSRLVSGCQHKFQFWHISFSHKQGVTWLKVIHLKEASLSIFIVRRFFLEWKIGKLLNQIPWVYLTSQTALWIVLLEDSCVQTVLLPMLARVSLICKYSSTENKGCHWFRHKKKR